MERVKLGTKVKTLGINRAVCADGCKGRAVLLDQDARIKYLAFDEKRKRRVEVTPELVVNYGLKPYTAVYYLVGRLNTDMNGLVVGDQITVEYIQLSETLNNDFADLVLEMGENFNSLAITKVSKKGPEGQDFSHLVVKPSNYQLSPELQQKVDALRNDHRAIETMWGMIDSQTSLSADAYIALLKEEGEIKAEPTPALPNARGPIPQIESSSFSHSNDFDSDEGFN